MTTPEVLGLGMLGLMIGSFLNVCVARLPKGESIVSPGSRCPHCAVPIRWFDNVPVLSYLVLGGRCRSCRIHISLRYPIVELLTALAFVSQGLVVGEWGVWLAARLIFVALLTALAATDLETYRLPNSMTLGGTAVGLLASVYAPPGWQDAALGVLLGGGLLLAIRGAWLAATGTDAMGLGDVKMLAMIGAFLGWQQVWLVLLVSTVAGAVVGIALTTAGTGTLRTKLPFGVFLSLGAAVAAVVGTPLLEWYLGVVLP
jgi:leader peptidase (prepilin peptidase)/N-methyltransferase